MEQKRIFTIPNLLTFSRLLILIPIMINVVHVQRGWALFWILLSIATDNVDGYVARKLKQESDLGRIMDPLIDKINLLAATTYMVFSADYDFPLWFYLFLFIRETAVLAGGLLVLRNRKIVLEANRAGKWSAFITGFTVLFFIMDWQPFGWILLWGSCVLTILSTWTYIETYRRTVRKQGRGDGQ
ncbi:MAG TPA: CDP-alcohol phosphatidyltransferase family protein [bacterium]|nr:CDP-alcohol phosphatidyltransferase family protein [bacterium]